MTEQFFQYNLFRFFINARHIILHKKFDKNCFIILFSLPTVQHNIILSPNPSHTLLRRFIVGGAIGKRKGTLILSESEHLFWSLKLFTRNFFSSVVCIATFYSTCSFYCYQNNRGKMDPSPILSVIHAITIGITISIMLNFNGGNNGHELQYVTCKQTFSVTECKCHVANKWLYNLNIHNCRW